MDVVQQDLKQLKLNVNITEDRAEWRRRTHVADPSPQRDIQLEGERRRSLFTLYYFYHWLTVKRTWSGAAAP